MTTKIPPSVLFRLSKDYKNQLQDYYKVHASHYIYHEWRCSKALCQPLHITVSLVYEKELYAKVIGYARKTLLHGRKVSER